MSKNRTPKIEPLRCRTLTLDELRSRIINLIQLTRKQLARRGWEAGMTDEEFIDQILDPLEHRIRADIDADAADGEE